MENDEIDRVKDEMLRTFASGVAHNFNNILTAGMGFLSLAMDMTTDREILAMLRNVELCHKRISHLARQLLSFTGDIATSQTKIFLSEALSNALNIFDSIAMKHHAVLVCDFSHVRDVMIMADRFQLVQALVQILKNAAESCHGLQRGQVKFRAETSDGKVRIIISDNGCGIEQERLDKLGSPFYTTKQVVGVGLGLSMAISIIRKMGGDLRISSEVGKGTTAEISFPVAPAGDLDSQVHLSTLIPDLNVLLAIDAEQTREALTGVLMSYSLMVNSVDCERDLLQELDRKAPGYDLVIVDLLHNETMGDDLIDLLRKHSAASVIYLYSSDAEKPQESESVATLAKPFEPLELVALLCRFKQIDAATAGS